MSGKQPKRKPRPGVDEYGRIPLHYAAVDGDCNSLVRLLESGSAINAQDDNGWTALHFAAQGGHLRLVEELLSRGANPNLLNSHGNGPIWLGVMHGRGDFSVVRALVAAGADPDQKNAYGHTAREVAISKGVAGEASL
jgi:uncharacterized protein